MTLTSAQFVRAHQYLYYVGVYQQPRMEPVLSDHQYDSYCHVHGIEGGGGSDLASSYTAEEVSLAKRLYERADPEVIAHLKEAQLASQDCHRRRAAGEACP